MSAPDADRIALRGMRFHTCIGVLPHEREHPQPVEVDLVAWVRGGGILDYRELYADVRATMDVQPLDYLEHLADTIAARVLQRAAVERVRVSIRKPHAALGGPLDHVEVSVVRDRGESHSRA